MRFNIRYLDSDPYEVTVADPDEHIQRSWVAGVFYEGARADAMLHRIYTFEKGLTYVDVGACIGNHSIFFAHVMKAEQVIAIEPNATNFILLVENTEHLPVVPIRAAAGAVAGRCATRRYGPAYQWGMTEVIAGDEVPVLPIDEICKDVPRVDVIKIDVEHDNDAVCAGMIETLRQFRPVVFIEASGEELEAADAFFHAHRYTRTAGPFNATPTWEYRG